jgi:hypothetical protein
MLPDFRRVKRKLMRGATGAIQAAAGGDGILAHIPRKVLHEGNRFTIYREDGSVETRTLRETKVGVEITLDEIQREGIDAASKKLTALAADLAHSNREAMLEAVSRAAEEVGNVRDAGGKPFTAEMYIEMADMTEGSFRANGDWVELEVVPGFPTETMHKRIETEMARLDTDPDLRAKLDAVIDSKRREWRDRESNRKLAD